MRAFLLALVLAALTAGCGGSDDGGEAGAPIDECQDVEAPDPREAETREAPTDPLASGTTYTLTFETSCGAFSVELDPALAPQTSASLVALAGDGYFDGTVFHRVVPGFVIQGGDPTQTGGGGPGYSTLDAPPSDARYTQGVVAMAKAGFEPAGTSGSQFFVVTGEDVGLPPEYAVVGTVTDGMDAVMRVDALGVGDGPPSQAVVVERVSVSES